MRSDGTSRHSPDTSTGGSQRGLATRNGRAAPSSASSPSSSPSPQRTITAVAARTRRTHRRRGSNAGPRRARARSRATARGLEPAPRQASRPRARARPRSREMNVTPCPASTAILHRLLEAELEPDAEVAAAASRRRAARRRSPARTPAPSCMAIRPSSRSSSSEIVLPANGWSGRADEDHLVAEERLVRDGSVPRRRSDDAELELAARDLLDDRLRVRDRQRRPLISGFASANSQSRTGTTVPPGPVDAPSASCPRRGPSAPPATSSSSCRSSASMRCALR